jgi:hypothetical protein
MGLSAFVEIDQVLLQTKKNLISDSLVVCAKLERSSVHMIKYCLILMRGQGFFLIKQMQEGDFYYLNRRIHIRDILRTKQHCSRDSTHDLEPTMMGIVAEHCHEREKTNVSRIAMVATGINKS